MKIGITGGNGFIGSTLALELLKLRCHEVTIYSNKPLEYSDKLSEYNYKLKIGDLRLEDECADIVENDIIFHLAQINLVDSKDILSDLQINSLISGYIVQECIKRNKMPLIILASTNNIIRTNKSSPPSIWSLHKLFSEQYLNYYKDYYSGRVIILRIPNVYGEPVNIKKYENSALNKIHLMASDGMIKLFKNSKKKRAFIHVEDLVDCMITLIDQNNLKVSTLYAGDGDLTSYEEIAFLIKEHYNDGNNTIKIVRDNSNLNYIEMQDDVLHFPNIFVELKINPKNSLLNFLRKKYKDYEKNKT